MLTSSSHYIIAAALARADGAAEAFAAYSLGQAVAILFEWPSVALRSAATSMATGPAAWVTLHRTAGLVLSCTLALQAALFFTPVGPVFLHKVAGVPTALIDETLKVSRITTFAVLGSSLRFLYQGIQIRWRATDGVLAGIITRLALMGAVAWICTATGWPGGAAVGGLILASGMLIEGFVGYLGYRRTERRGAAIWDDLNAKITVGATLKFVIPLALSGVLIALGRPAINAALAGNGPAVVAAFALSSSMTQLFQAPIGNLHQVSLVFGRNAGAERRGALRFALLSGLMGTLATGCLVIPPVGRWVLGSLIGADPGLIPSTLLAVAMQVPIPFVMSAAEHQTGLLFVARRSRVVSVARVIRFGVTIAVLWAALSFASPFAAPAVAVGSLLTGVVVEWALLTLALYRAPAPAVPSVADSHTPAG